MQSHRRTGCGVCWKRKLKCDSLPPASCANCMKRGVECRYEERNTGQELQGLTVPSPRTTEAGIPRDRAQQACSNCAVQKLKCSGEHDGCLRCAQNELACQYPISKRRSRKVTRLYQTVPRPSQKRDQSLRSAAASQDGSSLTGHLAQPSQSRELSYELPCAKDIIRQHLNAYFEYIYPITTHGFLHQGILLEQLDEGRAPTVLLQAIAVSASRFVASTTEVAARQVARWVDEVDIYIMNSMGVFSILNLQIIILWANYHSSSGNFGKTWMLLGSAARLAYCLQLNVEPTTGSASQRECRRRMMWNIRIMDRLLAGTIDEFSLSSRYMESLKIPCDEHSYLTEIPVETRTLESFGGSTYNPSIGGFSGLVGLFEIWHEILLFMRDLSRNTAAEKVMQQVSALRQKLSAFEQRLPSNLRFVSRNLYLHPNNAQKITFIILQSWWHECHCDLYRFSLLGFRESVDLSSETPSFMKQCQQQVLQSALAQSNLWRSISHMGYLLASDPTIVVLVHSNTRTLLSARRTQDLDRWKEGSIPGESTNISALLASNVSFLDEFAKKMPRVANIQREIQNMIQNNGYQASSEAALNSGLPLRRRHSREELFVPDHQEEQKAGSQSAQLVRENSRPQSSTDSNTVGLSACAARPEPQKSLVISDDASTMASTSISSGTADIYMRMPISPEEIDLGALGVPAHRIRQEPEWVDTPLGQTQTFRGEGDIESGQLLGLYQGSFIGGMPGYFAPFENAAQGDMFFAAGNDGLQETDNFGMQFWM